MKDPRCWELLRIRRYRKLNFRKREAGTQVLWLRYEGRSREGTVAVKARQWSMGVSLSSSVG